MAEDNIVQLSGEDGNAFAILSRMRKSMKKAGATPDDISAFVAQAFKCTYDELLQLCFKTAEKFGITIQ